MSLRILLSCSAERLRPSPSERPRLPVATAAQPPALYAFVAEMIVPWLNSTTLDTSASFIPLSRSLTARRRRSLSASTESVLPSVRSMPHSTHLEKKLQQFLAGSIGTISRQTTAPVSRSSLVMSYGDDLDAGRDFSIDNVVGKRSENVSSRTRLEARPN